MAREEKRKREANRFLTADKCRIYWTWQATNDGARIEFWTDDRPHAVKMQWDFPEPLSESLGSVVGWAMKTTLRTELVLEALDMALGQRRPAGVIHHSDQGSQGGFK